VKGKLLAVPLLALAVGAWWHSYHYTPPMDAPLPVPQRTYQLDHLKSLGVEGMAYQQQADQTWVITVEKQPCAQIDGTTQGVRVWFLLGWRKGMQSLYDNATVAVQRPWPRAVK